MSLVRRTLTGVLARLLRRPLWRARLERLGGFPRAEPSRRFDVADLEHVYQVLERHDGTLDIGRETGVADLRALARLAQEVARPGMVIVEVGSWKGGSTAVLAHVARAHGGRVFAVDHWRGNPGVLRHAQAGELDVLSLFRRNLRALGLDDVVHPLVMPSAVAAELFPPAAADLIFLDGDHRYHAVRDDLKHWHGKLRPGGLLCGHDSETFYGCLSPEDQRQVDEHREEDTVGPLHPGVVRALYDAFADAHRIVSGTTIWYLPTETVS